ncbi:DUF1149 family protein [Vagococcus elongatus]|uniref:Uncharacterized protein n=1 Tax=Vagococcus elongatus TaxID=180344 RepID=A0A430AXB1_9ENTE|nr:DUF1149 family protein [Vagococcus elongatus]RSU12700.1 hypothetical protein CBF29_06120 [Vagococcus elongatus]
MNIVRQPEFVEAFHYDMNQNTKAENEIRVEVNPIDMSGQPDFPADKNSVLGIRVVFKIAFEEFVLTGAVRQLVTVTDRTIEANTDLSQEEVNELVRPLFSIIERLTYEVTEIALDRPGLKLNFESESKQ